MQNHLHMSRYIISVLATWVWFLLVPERKKGNKVESLQHKVELLKDRSDTSIKIKVAFSNLKVDYLYPCTEYPLYAS